MIEIVMEVMGMEDAKQYRTLQIVLVCVLFTFPSSLPKHVTSCKIAPAFTMTCLIYCCVLLLAEIIPYWKHGALNSKISYFKLNMDFFDAFGTTFFAYMCQPNYFEVIKDLEKRDCNHQKRVLLIYVLICF